MKLRNLVRNVRRWYVETPERALDEAYQAALKIKAIEDEHFQGQAVGFATESDYSDRVLSYFKAEVKNNITTINVRLAEFRATRIFLGGSDRPTSLFYDTTIQERSAIIIEKLNFIDGILAHYNPSQPDPKKALSLTTIPPQSQAAVPQNPQKKNFWGKSSPPVPVSSSDRPAKPNLSSAAEKTGAVPRSILNTFSRVKRELDPQSLGTEGEVVQKFRQARDRTAIAVKFLLLLVIIPLLTHQITKTFLIAPLIEQNFFSHTSDIVFLNQDLQAEAFVELEQYEKSLRLSTMLGLTPPLSESEREEKVKEKAIEVAEEYRHEGANAVSNIFADLFSLAAFAGVIVASRREIQILKDFIDEIIYGLSDSAKAFLIILFTDMFVGFHSPHGWEVILEGISHHFGLPESREFNFLFIATFPVILDTVLKYWIFRYLNRISPSAVATYKTMNE
ncbi:proton extrusion protein PcxA [Spirulina major CS-329]|uniref:proton extrusion protein PcxA n=1 Tax=Spirulina TaxID=1154 RepID=UPI00232A7DF8|nr:MULTISPECIES: proton extrusion protein PcxA [Spirulina]MDB9494217.1 proton extrusion protein PcxA [Spirulina subsalsa CS-330]MDB9503053.1 proton extrusion protein PcxA [Spirulina major CS-329]